jgi:hypothetical protein
MRRADNARRDVFTTGNRDIQAAATLFDVRREAENRRHKERSQRASAIKQPSSSDIGCIYNASMMRDWCFHEFGLNGQAQQRFREPIVTGQSVERSPLSADTVAGRGE